MLTVAEKKRVWFDQRRAELHAKGLTDGKIADQMGYKPAYFSQIANGASIGDGFIDKMCSAFGFRFMEQAQVQQSANVQGTTTVNAEQFKELLDQVRMQTHLLNALVSKLDK